MRERERERERKREKDSVKEKIFDIINDILCLKISLCLLTVGWTKREERETYTWREKEREKRRIIYREIYLKKRDR